MCSDLSLIRTALTGDKSYNLGAIVARRLQHNAGSGYFYGGIYATRLARELGVSPFPYDTILLMQYLDFDAMKRHKILSGEAHNFTYNLVFNVRTRDIIPLPAPALFDPVARGGYRIMPADIIAYRNAQAVAEAA